jgi:adenosine deaminase
LNKKDQLYSFINQVPKAELHVHLEGTIEPEMMFAIADRNGIRLKYKNIEETTNAYQFKDLRDFLILYNEGTKILKTSQDFYDITLAYLQKSSEQNILHTEIFIDFQTYLRRGMAPEIQIEGICAAIDESKKQTGISAELILCFLRHLGPESAIETYEIAKKFRDKIIGFGLASTEIGYPPELFEEVFAKARQDGFKTVAHAGEEGPWEYVLNSIDVLQVDRIDHGNKSCQNKELTQKIIERQIPLTLCPLSNIKLRNVDSMENHTVKKMLDENMLVTINSDDPAYFGGYVNENLIAIANTFDLQMEDIYQLAKNSFTASFIDQTKKIEFIDKLNEFYLNQIKLV